MDNKKKKGLDSKRIALKQKHEVDYLREKSRLLVRTLNMYLDDRPYAYLKMHTGTPKDTFIMPASTVRRIAQAFLKITKKR